MIGLDSIADVDGRRVAEDISRFVARSRALLGLLLATTHERFRTVLAIYVTVFVGTFYALRLWVWPRFEADLLPRGAVVVAARPFEVVLLQIQVSAIVCSVFTTLVVCYLSRAALAREGLSPAEPAEAPSKARVVGFGLLTCGTFATGVGVAYFLVIAVLFDVLAANAVATGLEQTYSIIEWGYYIVLVSLSWGFAVSLPVVMAVLASEDVIAHETFRANWRYAVVLTIGVGAVISMLSNDPIAINMLVVVAPVILLYRVGVWVTSIASNPDHGHCTAVANPDVTTADGINEATETSGTSRIGDVNAGDANETVRRFVEDAITKGLGVANRFRTEEITTEDLHEYYRDAAFVGRGIWPSVPRITAVFTIVTALSLGSLYHGGLNAIRSDFSHRLPAPVTPDRLDIVLLTPAEALMTELKVAIALGVIAVSPLVCYHAWPALVELGVARGDRSVFKRWALVLFVGLSATSLGSYLFVAPRVVGYLIHDVVRANMIVAYQVPSFLFFLFFVTVGVGLCVEIPLTMALFQQGRILSYEGARTYWWVVVIGVGIFTSALTVGPAIVPVVGIPLVLAYGLGLRLLRYRSKTHRSESSKSSDPEAGVGVRVRGEETGSGNARGESGETNSGTNWTLPGVDRRRELAGRFVPAVVLLAVVGVSVFPFTEGAVTAIWYALLPADATPRVYAPLSLVLARLELALLAGLVVSLPVLLYGTFRLVRPEPTPHERRYSLAAVPASLVLAIVGIGFAVFAVVPVIFTYFLSYTDSVTPSAFGLATTFGFILLLSGFFALAFQIPLVVLVAITTRLTTRQWFAERRLYFWGSFVALASVSSSNPTGIAPTIAAVTMVTLFEGSMLVSLWRTESDSDRDEFPEIG